MSNVIAEIYAGWKNYTFKNTTIEKIAKNRLNICANCVDTKTGKSGVTNLKTCRYCGCYVPAKIRSVGSKCPLNKW